MVIFTRSGNVVRDMPLIVDVVVGDKAKALTVDDTNDVEEV